MKKINLTVTGCLGRMGQQLIRSAKNNKDFKIVSLTENKKVNRKLIGINPQLNTLISLHQDSYCPLLKLVFFLKTFLLNSHLS